MFCRKFCFFKYLHKDFIIKILDAFNAFMNFIGKFALVIEIHSFFQRTGSSIGTSVEIEPDCNLADDGARIRWRKQAVEIIANQKKKIRNFKRNHTLKRHTLASNHNHTLAFAIKNWYIYVHEYRSKKFSHRF